MQRGQGEPHERLEQILVMHVSMINELKDLKSGEHLALLGFIIILSCLEAPYGECAPTFDMCNHLL